MVDLQADQAAGLRRLFPRRHAQVIAFVGASSATAGLVSGCAQTLSGQGSKVLILDEQRGTHSALASLGLATRYDLAQALQGDVRLETATVFKGPKLHAISAARAARGEGAGAGTERDIWQRCTRNYDCILINGAPEPSRFVAAATACVLVVAAQGASLTAAYRRLKRIRAVAAKAAQYLVIEAAGADASRLVQENLTRVARAHLGIEIDYLGALAPGAGDGAAARSRTYAQVAQLLSRRAMSGAASAGDNARRSVADDLSTVNPRHLPSELFRPAAAGSL